jgi:hypothetical protein
VAPSRHRAGQFVQQSLAAALHLRPAVRMCERDPHRRERTHAFALEAQPS